jgi:murein endopeptidase
MRYGDRPRAGSRTKIVRPLCLIAATVLACGFVTPSARGPDPAPALGVRSCIATRTCVIARPDPKLEWHRSRPVGAPGDGALRRGVRLPRAGAHYFTWDPVLRRSPNRGWRRWGTDRLVRLVLRVARDFAAAHPKAARIGVGDLSRPHGGYFGPKHATHQNGLDADIYYPRRDGRERPPLRVSQIDVSLAQDLVDRFVAAGVDLVYVGPNTSLTGPSGVVIPLWNHDNHLHVRIRFPPR